MTTPQFLNIGNSSAMPLSALVPSGDDVDGVEIQTLDAAGRTVDAYTWNTWMWENPCWVTGDELEPVTDVDFASGQGLWVFGANSEQGIQSAGQVGKDDVVIALRAGATGAGNPFPVLVDINDIIPTGDDVDGVEIQTLDAAGRTVDAYTWNTWMWENPCWVTGDELEPVTDVDFAPGQGLWIFGASAEQGVRFPAPEL